VPVTKAAYSTDLPFPIRPGELFKGYMISVTVESIGSTTNVLYEVP
jgi:hypothetical protein